MADNENDKDVLEALTTKLVEENKDQIYGLRAPVRMQIMREDGAYRTHSMEGNEEFMLKGLRMGARKQVIFEFTPVDAQPYKQAELGEGTVFQVFPELEADCVDALGQPGREFAAARAAFNRAFREELKRKKAEAKKQEKDAEANAHGEIPDWGRF